MSRFVAPKPSFPSLKTLLSGIPDPSRGGSPYTNDDLYDAWVDVEIDVMEHDEPAFESGDRPTPTVLISQVPWPTPPPAPTRSRMWIAPLAFALGIFSTVFVDQLAKPDALAAHEGGVSHATAQADPHQVVVSDVTVAPTVDDAPAPKAKPRRARRRARAVTPEQNAPAENAPEKATEAAPEAPAEAPTTTSGDARDDARAALAAALTGDVEPETRAFDKDVARAVLAGAVRVAKRCGDGSVKGGATVTVTYANSGRATTARLDPASPLAGTTVGSCVASTLASTRVPAYDGDVISVRRFVNLR